MFSIEKQKESTCSYMNYPYNDALYNLISFALQC